MQLKVRGISAAAVLVAAVAAGMVGGALAVGATGADPVAPPAVTLHQIADQATVEPTVPPQVDRKMEVPAAPAPTEEDAVAPKPTAAERAEEAADRAAADAATAKDAADRAKVAAERAETPKVADVPAPKIEPSPPRIGNVDGTAPQGAPKTEPKPAPAPAPVEAPRPQPIVP